MRLLLCVLMICISVGAATRARADTLEDVSAVIHQTAENWNSQDYSNVLSLWDKNDPEPFYLAEERDAWLIGWEQLNGYLNPGRQNPAIQGIREEMSNIRIKEIAPDLVIAIFDMHFEMKVIGRDPIGEDIRVTATLRKTSEGWRYIHWAEAPMAGMVYIEKLFQQDVNQEAFQKVYEKRQNVLSGSAP